MAKKSLIDEKFYCTAVDCSKSFKSSNNLLRHMAKYHPTPAPKKKTERAPDDLPESLRLVGGNFKAGDVFWHIRKFAIKKITYTEGSDVVDVEADCLKRYYQVNQPE